MGFGPYDVPNNFRGNRRLKSASNISGHDMRFRIFYFHERNASMNGFAALFHVLRERYVVLSEYIFYVNATIPTSATAIMTI